MFKRMPRAEKIGGFEFYGRCFICAALTKPREAADLAEHDLAAHLILHAASGVEVRPK